MTVKPHGMQDSVKHEKLFDPQKPVKICFWLMDEVGWAMGFSQMVKEGDFFGGLFCPEIPPVEWDCGNIKFGDATRERFSDAFMQVYRVKPSIQ